MTHRFLAFDLVTEAALGELAVSQWRSADDLNDSGSFDATLILDDPAATITVVSAEPLTDDGEPLTDDGELLLMAAAEIEVVRERNTATIEACRPGKTLIIFERNGIPEFSGIPWRRTYSAESRTFKIAGRGLGSYFDHFTQGVDYSPAAIDQMIIFNILAVGATDDTDIGIIDHGETSGVTKSREYLRLAGKTRGELMRELATTIDGFDFDFRTEYNGDTPERHMRLFFPRRGLAATESNLTFRIPGNASLVSVDEDATNIAAQIQAVGAGSDVTLIEEVVASTELPAAGYPNYRAFSAHKDIPDVDQLVEIADAELRDRSVTDRETFVININPDDEMQPYGSWDLGSDAYLVIEDDPRFPAQTDGSPGLVTTRRVVSHTWNVDAAGETLNVGLDLVSAVRWSSPRTPSIDPESDTRLRALEGY